MMTPLNRLAQSDRPEGGPLNHGPTRRRIRQSGVGGARAVSAQVAVIHEMFVSTLGISSGWYAATEAANAAAAG